MRMHVFDDTFHDEDIGSLVVPSHIVDLSTPSLLQDHVYGLAVVCHIKPVTNLHPITINGKFLVVEAVVYHQRDELFRELVGSVVVGTTGNIQGKLVGIAIGLHEQVCCCLARRVGAVRIKRCCLGKEAFWAQIPIHLIRRNLLELDPVR